MKKEHDSIRGLDVYKTEARFLLRKGGIIRTPTFVKAKLISEKSPTFARYWIRFHVQKLARQCTRTEDMVYLRLDDYRVEYRGSMGVANYVPAALESYPYDDYPYWCYFVTVNVDRLVLAKMATASMAQVRVCNIDVDMPHDFRAEAAAMLQP
jgi:hypothetical protein